MPNPKDMTTDEAGINFILNHEGYFPAPYWDNNHYSIGYGTQATPSQVVRGTLLSPADARRAAEDYIRQEAERDVKQHVKVDLTQNQFNALVSLAYNMGGSNFGRSRS